MSLILPRLSQSIPFLGTTNQGVRPSTGKIDLVILHATVGGFEASVDWLRKSDRDNRTSAHYVIAKNGAVVQLVEEKMASWHSGYGSWKGFSGLNSRSIGIELENKNSGADPYPEPQLESCLYIVSDACHRWGIPPPDVVGHLDVDPIRKTDPAGFPWERFRESLLSIKRSK